MAYNEQVYDEARDNPHGFDVTDDGVYALTRTAGRTASEKAAEADEFRRAVSVARQRLGFVPSKAQRWLNLLAWCAASVRVQHRAAASFTSESAQFIALHALRTAQMARVLSSDESGDLRLASKALWAATESVARSVASSVAQAPSTREVAA